MRLVASIYKLCGCHSIVRNENKMTDKLEILVVEDQPKHLADVKVVLDGRKQYGIEADYVSTLDDTKRKLEEKKYDGILSDVFFPKREGEEDLASGLWVAEYGIQNGVPFILVTSTYHHGEKTEPVNKWLSHKGLQLVDWQGDGSYYGWKNSEGDRKNWEGGFLSLMSFIEGVKEGLTLIEPDSFGKPADPKTETLEARYMIDIVNCSTYGEIPNFYALTGSTLSPSCAFKVDFVKKVFDKYGKDLFS